MKIPWLTYEALLAVGISSSIARFVTAEQHPIPNFDIFAGKIFPGSDYHIPIDVVDVIGLWDVNCDAYVRWTRGGQHEFVFLPHDSPEFSVVAWSEQGLLVRLAESYRDFLNWHDAEEDRRRLLKFIDYIGFRYGKELDSFRFQEGTPLDYEAQFKAAFGRLP